MGAAGTVHGEMPPWKSIVPDKWQYIEYHSAGREFYDLDADPYQWANVAQKTDTSVHEWLLDDARRYAGTECP
jgi:hypothetical protein